MSEARAVLAHISDEAHEKYPRNTARLSQLDAALATADMALSHLEDEEIRHSELAHRVRIDESEAERHKHQIHAAYKEA